MPVQDGETGRIDAGGLNAVAGQLQAGLNGLPAGSGLQNPVVTSGLPELLSGLATALVVARSQLDSDTAGQIMRLLRSIVHDEGITAIVATHDPGLIALADRVLNLKDGVPVP